MIELHLAWAWDCDECGRENFERSITGEFSDEELREMLEEHGVTPYESGEFCTAPKKVKCKWCGEVFVTANGAGDD